MGRIDNLTGFRAYVSIWVVIFHLTTATDLKMNLGPFLAHGSFGVDALFVLSGMILAQVYASRIPERFNLAWYRKFLTRRFAKIYPMHLITFLMMVALVLYAKHGNYRFTGGAENTWWSALCTVLMIHAFGLTHANSWNFPSWSVSAFWFAYVALFPPIAFRMRYWRISSVAALATILWVAYIVACRFVFHVTFELTSQGVVRIIPEFLVGYLLYRFMEKKKPEKFGDLCSFAGLGILVIVAYWGSLALLLMPGVMLLLWGAYAGGRLTDLLLGNKLAVLLGEASYSIYMVQVFPILIFNQLIRRAHLTLTTPLILSIMLIEIVVIAACGWLAYRYLEDPLHRVLLNYLAPAKQKDLSMASS